MYSALTRCDYSLLFSWKGLIKLLNKPCDPSLLAYLRIGYGLLMMIDIPQERGMASVDSKFDENIQTCRFPYVHSLQPMTADNMTLVYLALFISACGIMLGFLYRLSAVIFSTCYWYIFLLDKSVWNNHSYLYGIFSLFFVLVDANRYASIDGLINKKIRNTQVPQWNYTLIRFQVFIVYFLAGIKKLDMDWQQGYSMINLAQHWVFNPFKSVVDEDTLNLFMVHKFGFLFDLTVGFWLFWDKTRFFAFIFCASFNLMNSQIFSIGMFPWAMLATMFCFCKADSFKKLIAKLPFKLFQVEPAHKNTDCVNTNDKSDISWKHHITVLITITWMCVQLFIPFSHFITLGYNGWTEGPYGYSWDMMVQNTRSQHIKITYVDKNGQEGYLKSNAFLRSRRERWSMHPDHAVQYARCLKDKLQDMNVEDAKIYFDVWKSLNQRFMQRVFDPSVDIASYDWSPFKRAEFVLPVMLELSGWREKLKEMKDDHKQLHHKTVFIADFPGLFLENFVDKNDTEVKVELLKGEVVVNHFVDGERINTTLTKPGQSVHVANGEFHTVYTVSKEPSCYFYSYHVPNATQQLNSSEVTKRRPTEMPPFTLKSAVKFWKNKYFIFRRAFVLVKYALKHKIVGKPSSQEELISEIEDKDYGYERKTAEKLKELLKKEQKENDRKEKDEL